MSPDDVYFQADIDLEDNEEDDSYHKDTVRAESAGLEASGLRGPLRRGKWTMEEETYANKIIHYFNCGSLAIPARTTLRSFLSEKLNW